MGPAYFLPGAKAAPAADIPAFHRLLTAGPWQVSEINHPHHGWGALVWWFGEPEPQLDRPMMPCPDGLFYLSSTPLPPQERLAKPNCPRGIDVQLACGALVTMPLAAAAPRRISFSTGAIGGPADEYGILAAKVFDRLRASDGGLPLGDPELLRVIVLGLSLAYRITPELLDDLGWITTADLDPLLCAMVGTDPKAFEPAATSLPSHAAGSLTFPSPPARSPSSPSGSAAPAALPASGGSP